MGWLADLRTVSSDSKARPKASQGARHPEAELGKAGCLRYCASISQPGLAGLAYIVASTVDAHRRAVPVRCSSAVVWRAKVAGVHAIQRPFADVAMHVVQAESVGRIGSDGVVRLKPQLVPSVEFYAQQASCSGLLTDQPLLNFFAFSLGRFP